MFSGHLYLHLDLGTGHVKIRVSQMRIDDGKWHNFHTERTKQYGKVTLDGQGNDFSLPGIVTKSPQNVPTLGDQILAENNCVTTFLRIMRN